MCAGLVLLANGTTSNEVVDKDREAGPPEVVFDNSFSAETAEVT